MNRTKDQQIINLWESIKKAKDNVTENTQDS